jgi:2-deoxy-D-gluconate 3-dehydrogenase
MTVDADPGHYLDSLLGLRGKTAVVIGGTSGLGEQFCLALVQAGASVCVAGRDRARGEAVVGRMEALGGAGWFAPVDVTDEASVVTLARQAVEHFGRVDILVNSAGVFSMKPTLELSLAEWSEMVAINLTGTFLAAREFGRHMVERGSGKIINLASTDAVVGVPEEAAYCATKGGVLQLTRVLGAEFAPLGVQVNALGPTDFRTPLIADALADPGYEEWTRTVIPKGRIGEPHELEGALLLLASDAAEMMAGHCLMVDGGRTVV